MVYHIQNLVRRQHSLSLTSVLVKGFQQGPLAELTNGDHYSSRFSLALSKSGLSSIFVDIPKGALISVPGIK